MLECLHETLVVHPTVRLQEECGPRSSPSLEIGIHLLSCDDEYWRETMPCSINNPNESHMIPSFPSNLRSNRTTFLANNLTWLHHSGQATLIQVEDSGWHEIVSLDSFRVSLEEDFNVYAVESHRARK